MWFIPPNEKIVEKKICRLSWQEFFVTDKDLEFYEKISPVFAGQKVSHNESDTLSWWETKKTSRISKWKETLPQEMWQVWKSDYLNLLSR